MWWEPTLSQEIIFTVYDRGKFRLFFFLKCQVTLQFARNQVNKESRKKQRKHPRSVGWKSFIWPIDKDGEAIQKPLGLKQELWTLGSASYRCLLVFPGLAASSSAPWSKQKGKDHAHPGNEFSTQRKQGAVQLCLSWPSAPVSTHTAVR